MFAHPRPDRPANLPPILDPFDAARQALSANGSAFMDRAIRVDGVAKSETSEAFVPPGVDPKKSVFLGGLDYTAKEDDVRALFEGLMVAEKGDRVGGWVKSVRLVRDKETQLGKGFGYVHFVVSQAQRRVLSGRTVNVWTR